MAKYRASIYVVTFAVFLVYAEWEAGMVLIAGCYATPIVRSQCTSSKTFSLTYPKALRTGPNNLQISDSAMISLPPVPPPTMACISAPPIPLVVRVPLPPVASLLLWYDILCSKNGCTIKIEIYLLFCSLGFALSQLLTLFLLTRTIFLNTWVLI